MADDNALTPTETKSMIPFLDKYLGRFVSKKLMVLAIGCFFLYLGRLTGEQWMWVAMIYIGGQSVIDATLSWKNGRRM